jgi:[pyruvate, water dikinase]-phosphate phosphotransferase / [pyruvate, water dikinase] kinase
MPLPEILIISDSLGDTAAAVAHAAASQFAEDAFDISRFYKASSITQIKTFLNNHLERLEPGEEIVLLYTIVDSTLRDQMVAFIQGKPIRAVDLISGAIEAIAQSTGERPIYRSGVNRVVDEAYFKRIAAMEFAVDHDDGRNPDDLTSADIVLVGVSRTSKTPLSMYLSSLGYKVANIPLATGVEPPPQLFKVAQDKVFGLISTPEVLEEIRRKRLGEAAAAVASSYVKRDGIEDDLDDARRVMRRIGCRVIRTDYRAIEDTAQEILRFCEP